MGNCHKFFKFIYENLSTNCILAMKPKPWRTSKLFEMVYGGWTLIRTSVITKYAKNKSIEYRILLILPDTYIKHLLDETESSIQFIASGQGNIGRSEAEMRYNNPFSIVIYSVIFKSNNFSEFKKAMTRIWLMFRCFK